VGKKDDAKMIVFHKHAENKAALSRTFAGLGI
jgi:hypothetical protein